MKLFAARFCVVAFGIVFASAAFGDTWVDGYYRADGTYVPGHYRTTPNGTAADNYSSKGNVNPYTGQPGTKDPDSKPAPPPKAPKKK